MTSNLNFREQLSSNMRDKELSEWTCKGIKSAAFFVATIDDEVVGTVAYKIKVCKQVLSNKQELLLK